MTYLSAPNASVVSLFMTILFGHRIKFKESSLIIRLLCVVRYLCSLFEFSMGDLKFWLIFVFFFWDTNYVRIWLLLKDAQISNSYNKRINKKSHILHELLYLCHSVSVPNIGNCFSKKNIST